MTIPGANTALIGATGTGKTYSLRTLPDAGITPFIIFTEQHGISVVHDIPCPKLHYTFIAPTTGTWEELIKRSEQMTALSWSAMSKMTGDPDKSRYEGFLRVVTALHNYKCDRCGESFGDVSTWGTDRAIVIDSLSGLNTMAMQMVTGESIARSQPQWGAAMNAELKLSDKLCADTMCHYILICHIDRVMDHIEGGTQITLTALGQKNAPEWPKNFSDIIHTIRDGVTWRWSTATPNADLKATNVPVGDKLPPSFGPFIKHWVERGGEIQTQSNVA